MLETVLLEQELQFLLILFFGLEDKQKINFP